MNLSRASVHRPVFTTMATLIVIILGGISLLRLPIDLMPDITYPTLSIRTQYLNASPEEIEELVTRPIEEAMSAVPGVEEVSSSSTEGSSSVRVTFSWGSNIQEAAGDVRDRLDRVIPRLPDDADRPVLFKFDLASFPILMLGASSNLDPIQLRRIIDDQVKYRIERLPGVASLDIRGGLNREIHVNLDPDKVKALSLSLDQILARISAENVNLPAGTIDRGNYEVTIRTPGEFTSLDELKNTVVAMRAGAPIQLREIASVEDSYEKVTQVFRINGQPGIRLSVSKQSGTNTVDVARRVLAEIDKINEDIPQIRLIPTVDTSVYIQRSIRNVGASAICGGALAVVILLAFLRNIRGTAIIATAIPISIIATFILIYFGGFTLNLMTLGGLALGVGMLVDNSIVVLENIYRLRESGQGPEEAAVNGSEEVTTAIVASTLTTVIVFLPLLFVQGMAGVMFKQLALVIGFALLCSMTVAVSLVPMLSAKILKRTDDVSAAPGTARETFRHKLFRLSGLIFIAMEDQYKDIIGFALKHRLVTLLIAVAVVASSFLLIPLIGVEFMPASDEGEVRISAEMEVGTRLAFFDENFRKVEDVVRRNVPEARVMGCSIGGSWHSSGRSGEINLMLKPIAQRKRSSEAIAGDLRKALAHIPGMVIRTRAGQGLRFMRMGQSSENVSVEIRGHDLQTAEELAKRVKKIVEEVDGISDARISRDSANPEELVIIDRQKAAVLKLSVRQIAEALQTVLGGTRASVYRESGDEYRILVKVKDADQMELSDILDMTLVNSDGTPIAIKNVVHVKPRGGPVVIERKNQERIVTVSANAAGRDMGSVLADITKGLELLPVPADFSINFGGDYEEQQKSFKELLLSLVLALILVYMVMACQYESLRDPFIVMFSVPMASVGVILMLFLTDTTFNVQSFIGCVMLGGIVVNNAIILVDHTNLLRRRDGMPTQAAIMEAGRRRLRPILMTALTTMLGLLPLAIGLGEGGEAQAPLARVVIGGLISSTIITLVIIPVIYSFFEGGLRRKAEAPETAAEGGS